MRITIVSPTSFDGNNQLIKRRRALLPPLSIFYLAGLTPSDHEVTAIDEGVQTLDFDAPTDLAAISSTTFAVKRAYQIAAEFRRRNVPVVMGGIHASALPEEALGHVDSVVIGEAEEVWQDVLTDLERRKLRRTYEAPRRESLDNLPVPRHDLIDRDKYLRLPFSKGPIFPIQTARGCPHACDFCSVSDFWGRKMRFRPVEDVVAEIRHSGADTFLFTDDNFIANPRRTLELAEALRPLKIRYICQIDSLAYRQPELLRALGRSGCFMAFVGFESLSDGNLGRVNKAFNHPSHYGELIGLLHRNGINVYASFILGFEHDGPETARTMAQFLIDQKVSLASFFRLTPFPGTRLYDRLVEQGYLLDQSWWLKRGEGPRSIVRYPEQSHSGEELSALAMGDFFAPRAILKRFFPFPLYKLPLVGWNVYAHQNVKRFNKVTIL